MFRSRILRLIALIAVLSPGTASLANTPTRDAARAQSTSPAPGLTDLATLGRGSLSWFGIPIYDAVLWSERGDFQRWGYDQRLALRIDYHRNIKAERLAMTTRKEWRRLAGQLALPDEDRREQWLEQLEQLWPDVAPGDFIVVLVEPGAACRFYGPDGPLGAVEDPDFGRAFLSIWLDPRTSRPDLRGALIGQSGAEG